MMVFLLSTFLALTPIATANDDAFVRGAQYAYAEWFYINCDGPMPHKITEEAVDWGELKEGQLAAEHEIAIGMEDVGMEALCHDLKDSLPSR